MRKLLQHINYYKSDLVRKKRWQNINSACIVTLEKTQCSPAESGIVGLRMIVALDLSSHTYIHVYARSCARTAGPAASRCMRGRHGMRILLHPRSIYTLINWQCQGETVDDIMPKHQLSVFPLSPSDSSRSFPV